MSKLDRILFQAMYTTIIKGIWVIILLLQGRTPKDELIFFRMEDQSTESRVYDWVNKSE